MADWAEDRDGEERRRATIEAAKRRATLIDRWAQEDLGKLDSWTERARAAVAHARPGMRVLDIGCGSMALEALLPEGCAYLPLDCVRRDERTIVCDINKEPFPAVDADMAFGLGVLEYIYDLPRFLRRLRLAVPRALLTYHPQDRNIGRDRWKLGWVNSLNSVELAALLRHAGFKTVQVIPYKPKLLFYLVDRAKA
ncbi:MULTISPECIES: methyltransferase domain-containing protein [Inquilinus]|uniref:SAM-dependent methyltransferase n=1 Tax=Inquilinus ginsengisoli TaxID=363840 RepID=A0ABU1JIT2_9PROT|nr:methyltransferase domain-containing protein [Inquilinus ginsengisoli]MDR6288534.1 SAM-dependent methyltransferase [Inquilinus ginsengisoli]